MTTDMDNAAHLIAELAKFKPQYVQDGVYLARDVSGAIRIIDVNPTLETLNPAPDTKRGTYGVGDPESLIAYVDRHGTDNTEMWASASDAIIVAIIDGHGPETPGWEKHRVTLTLQHSEEFTAWRSIDGNMLPQIIFAEFLELWAHTLAPGDMTAADMLELAQSIRVAKAGKFETTTRLKTGETQLVYIEEHEAAAGRKGQLKIPDRIRLLFPVFQYGTPVVFEAMFRYRIENNGLKLGVKLLRVQETVRQVFGDVASRVREETGRVVFLDN